MNPPWLNFSIFLVICTGAALIPGMANDSEVSTEAASPPPVLPAGEPGLAPPSPKKEEVALEARLLEVWRVPLTAPLVGALLASPEQVVASLATGEVQALANSDGRPIWSIGLEEELTSGPVLFEGKIVQATTSGRIVALDPPGGKVVWSVELGQRSPLPVTSSAGQLLVPLSGEEVVSLDGEGRERWRTRLSGQPAGPVGACGGFIVVGTDSKTVAAFDREDGSPLWELELGAAVASPFLCHRKLIYFGTDDYQFRAVKQKGKRKWAYKVGGNITAAPFVLDNRVYFLSLDNFLYALKAQSGNLVLKVKLSHRLSTDSLQVEDRIYLSPYTSARLLSLRLPELQLLSEYDLGLVGEWFTTPPARAGDHLFIGYGRTQGRVLALKEERASPSPPGP